MRAFCSGAGPNPRLVPLHVLERAVHIVLEQHQERGEFFVKLAQSGLYAFQQVASLLLRKNDHGGHSVLFARLSNADLLR